MILLNQRHYPLRLAYIEDAQEDAEAFLASWKDYRPRLQNQVDLFPTAEAYLRMQQVPFPLWHDIIVVDLTLPGLSGEEFIRIAKGQKELAGQSLIIATAKDGMVAQAVKEATGAEGWAEKPIRAAGILHELGALGDRYGLEIVDLGGRTIPPGRLWEPAP